MSKWEARKAGKSGGYNIYNEGVPPSAGKIAHIPTSTGRDVGGNARMIAAAPDLLEALQELLVRERGALHGMYFSDRDEIAAKAKKAIEKALGRH